MLIRSCLCVAALGLLSFPAPARAQVPDKVKKGNAGERKAVTADPLAEARRAVAISLVTSLADDARDFRDSTLRARVQARAADALWETDKDRSRVLFRRAWEAAEAGDEENTRRMEEDRRAQMARRGSAALKLPPNLRGEVLRLASKRDRALGEEFLAKFKEAKRHEAETLAGDAASSPPDASTKRRDPTQAPPAVAQRLELARRLIEDGDVERGLQFADPALNDINLPTINFLNTLRTKNAAAADQRYAALLSRATIDPASDANTVSLLSSYIFSPFFYMTFDNNGGTSANRWAESITPPSDLAPQLRADFFNAAAAILLRPLPPPDQDYTSSGRAGTYMVIARLLPLFEQHAPDKATAMRAQLTALLPDAPDRARDSRNNDLTKGLVPDEESDERAQDHLDRLDRARGSEEHDEIYTRAALAALNSDEARARELADKIADPEMRKQVRAYLDFDSVARAVRKKDAEATLRLARAGELTPIQRVWGLTEAARLLPKAEVSRALEIIEEAIVEARRIDSSSPERVRGLFAVATRLFEADRARAWEVLAEAIKASNSTTEFSGEDSTLIIRLDSKNSSRMMNFGAESFDLAGIFGSLAKEDFNRAVESAKSFTGESPRATATLAVVRTALESKDGGGRVKAEKRPTH